ncbi:MAG: hypothetical protein GF375_02020 [Candidatus Omnitrophica bacterium]|nr:hypothetical protein [Candidatus Omnitrophota bacterium]
MKRQLWRKADSIFEYGILIAIVIAAMAAMHHTIKRTINAEVKALTDEHIGPQGEDYKDSWLEKDIDSEEGYTESEFYLDKGESQQWVSDANRKLEAIDYSVKPPEILYPEVTVDEWDFSWALE